MLASCLALLLLSSATLVYSDDKKTACAYACQTTLNALQFDTDTPTQDYYAGECTNLLRVQSTYLCMRKQCSAEEIQKGLAALGNDCETYGMVSLPSWSVIDNITKEEEASLRVIEYNDLTLSGNLEPETFNDMVLVSNDLFAISLRTISAWDNLEVIRATYGYAMYGFWAVVLFIGCLNRFYVFLTQRRSNSSGRPSYSAQTSAVKIWIQRHITTPSLVGRHTAEPLGWCTIPNRLQSLTLIAFLIINVVLCFVSYDLFVPNLYWSTTKLQYWRYFADRTGCIAMANMPLIWAFGMRNNVLIWLTGWSFSTFNQFHRWVARIATVEAVLHSIAYTVEAFLEGGKPEYVADWAERYWWMGAIATITMSVLCGLAIYPLRALFYELFLVIHIMLAALFLAGMYYHVEIFDGQYNGYIWPCVAVWVFDRVLRLTRLGLVNYFSLSATISYKTDSDIIRLDVPIRRQVPLSPGTYFYVYILSAFRPWESHPFTLSSWTKFDEDNSATNTSNISKASFVIRPYSSFTSRLRNLALRTRDSESGGDNSGTEARASVRVILEGPYGTSHRLDHHDTVLFVIGGSGITVTLAYVRDLYDSLVVKNKISPLRRLCLVWAVRDRALFHDIFEREFATYLFGGSSLASKLHVQIDLYVTGSRTRIVDRSVDDKSQQLNTSASTRNAATPQTTSSPSSIDTKKVHIGSEQPAIACSSSISSDVSRDEEVDGDHDKVSVSLHRPHVHDIVVASALKFTSEKACDEKSMAIVSCGPARMADDARAGVVSALAKGCGDVVFLDERFGW